jgi:hypothetical protein
MSADLPYAPGTQAPGPVVPGPPPGPGVQAPFPAPPVEGRGRRIGMGVGIGAGLLALVAGVGVTAIIGVGAVSTRAINEQVGASVGGYFDALRDKHYHEAYEKLCASRRATVTEPQFTAEARKNPIASYRLGDLRTTDLTVPVDVRYSTGRDASLTAQLEQNRKTGGFEVCTIRE